MYPIKRKNKFNWAYKFLYWDGEENLVHLFTIETKEGFQVAESVAWGNATFDGCTNMEYLGKNKLEVENGTNA